MRHYVLTRAVYGPTWPLDENLRRLQLTRAVTAASLRAQTARDWTWVVLVDPRDPLLQARLELFRSAATTVQVLLWEGEGADRADIAFRAYHEPPWRALLEPRDDLVLQTRLDDDDGLESHALELVQRVAPHTRESQAAIVLPRGIRVWNHQFTVVYHKRNAMHTLVTRPGVETVVYDYPHVKVHRAAKVHLVDGGFSWLWVRHRDTLSDWRQALHPIGGRVRQLFPAVDWAHLEAMWS